ncbi:hypothetical protein L596_026833 [Steinernema carpocapsae]|uniref:Major facilitator superfamily (MFS) profile domain-containing protein n=1 Tax=Steinernema carpocapsae TaxID=34508 RepID=A0A4U5M2J1_STECR|nr:hypothetical protein L596_026833 [Steinernema carpocapsae]
MQSPLDQDVPKTDWKSLYIAAFLAFSAAVQFSLYFTSMWPYLQTIDPDATEEFFGLCVAAYSIALCIASPLFGYWSNRIKQIRLPMTVGIISMFLGNLIYLSCELIPTNPRYFLFFGRFLTGIGSANIPLLRAYTSTSCNPKDRARAMSLVTGGIATGTMIGPALQLFFTPLSYPGWVIFPNFSINMYTACAYMSCIMNGLSFFTLYYLFVEIYAGIHKDNVVKNESTDDSTVDSVKLPKFDKLAALICNITKFAQQFVFTNVEIIGSPYAMTVFAFTNQQTIQAGSIAQTGLGVSAVLIFAAFLIFKLNRYVKYRICIVSALFLLLGFLLVTFPWPFLPGEIVTHTNEDLANGTHEVVGCNVDKLDWCETTKAVNPWIYYIAFCLAVGVSYPMIDISLNTLYGKILGPRRQGFMQGLLQVSAGLARIIGPIMIGFLYSGYGPKFIWAFQTFVLGVTILLWAVFHKRMVALKVLIVQKSVFSITENTEKTNVSYAKDEN